MLMTKVIVINLRIVADLIVISKFGDVDCINVNAASILYYPH